MFVDLLFWAAIAANLALIAYNWRLARRRRVLIDAWEAICFLAWPMRHWPGMARLMMETEIELGVLADAVMPGAQAHGRALAAAINDHDAALAPGAHSDRPTARRPSPDTR